MTAKIEPLERIFTEAASKGEQSYASEGERNEGESYPTGWRNDIYTAVLKKGQFTVRAVTTRWVTFCPSSDSKGKRYLLEIFRGKKMICRATRDDGSKTDRFTGSDERFQGSNHADGNVWKLEKGKPPPSLCA